MKQSCEQFGELLSALHDGELSLSESQSVLSHLSDCQHCQETQREFALVDEILASPMTPASAPSIATPSKTLGSAKLTNSRSSSGSKRIWASIGVSTAALMMVGLSIFTPDGTLPTNTPEVSIPTIELEKMRALNVETQETNDDMLKTLELQIRMMRVDAKGLDPSDPEQAKLKSEIESLLVAVQSSQ